MYTHLGQKQTKANYVIDDIFTAVIVEDSNLIPTRNCSVRKKQSHPEDSLPSRQSALSESV